MDGEEKKRSGKGGKERRGDGSEAARGVTGRIGDGEMASRIRGR